jgi:ferritin-like metal-binding protein YciE
MNSKIKNLNEALTYQLEGLYDAEKKLQKQIPDLLLHLASSDLKTALQDFKVNRKEARIKLKRIFSYLLSGPYQKKNKVVDQLLNEVIAISEIKASSQLKDLLSISTFLAIVNYQLSTYRSAKSMASILDLDVVVEQLDEIIKWLQQTDRVLSKINVSLATTAS